MTIDRFPMFLGALLFMILVVLALVALLFTRVVFRGSTQPGAARVTRIVALLMAVILSGVGLWSTVQILSGVNVPVTVPVMPYWPEHPNITDVIPAHFATVDAHITEVQVVSNVLLWPTKILLASGTLCQTIASVAVLLGVAALCRQATSAEPFTNSLRRLGYRVAAVLGFSSFLGQILSGFGASRAGEETLHVSGYATEDILPDSAPWPEPAFGLNIEFSGIFMALVILVVVELVSAGMRLATENKQLHQDTDGLI